MTHEDLGISVQTFKELRQYFRWLADLYEARDSQAGATLWSSIARMIENYRRLLEQRTKAQG